MKKKHLIGMVMCLIALNAEAQTYAGDTWAQLPVADLYDTGAMNMSLNAYAEMAAQRQRMCHYYTNEALSAFKENRWYDVINCSSHAIDLDPNGGLFFIRGAAYESLGNLKNAKADYKKSKRRHFAQANAGLERVKNKMKQQKKNKR